MSDRFFPTTLRTLIGLLCLLWLGGCRSSIDWSPRLSINSKGPYGTFLAYHSLGTLFPGAEVHYVGEGQDAGNLVARWESKGARPALIAFVDRSIGLLPSEREALFGFVAKGNELLIAAESIDSGFLADMGLPQDLAYHEPYREMRLGDGTGHDGTYSYDREEMYIRPLVPAAAQGSPEGPARLGTLTDNSAHLLCYGLGKGKIYVYGAPVTFTNYFLLKPGNVGFMERFAGYFSADIEQVYWQSGVHREVAADSGWAIGDAPPTRYALVLGIFALLVYIAFEMKRKQRPVPVIPVTGNSTAAFVETIGRLYYSKKDHGNLALKMAQHFLEKTRKRYYLDTSRLDEGFARDLAAKSGKDLDGAQRLTRDLRRAMEGKKAGAEFVESLYQQIQHFDHVTERKNAS